jgi:low affinity Fe/Cu permease
VGSAAILVAATSATMIWIILGWFEQFPIRWFLATNLSMTVAVFLVLLLLQHSRRIHMRAIHAKLDELLRSGDGGNHMIASERMAEELLEELRAKHREMAGKGN